MAGVLHGGEGAEVESLSDAVAVVVLVAGGRLDVVDCPDLAADGEALLLVHRGAAGPGHGHRSNRVIPAEKAWLKFGEHWNNVFPINIGGKVALIRLRPLPRFNATFRPDIKGKTLHFEVHCCWAFRHSQGFEDKNLGSSPRLLGQLVATVASPRTPQILIFKT